MKSFKYIILGAGPSGLSFAHTLKSFGESSFLVIEKESVAGGLCRSERIDGAPLDIGGGHFLDTKRKDALKLIFQFMPRSKWLEFQRISKIKIRGIEIDYPVESNLWQLPAETQVDFIESIAQAGCVRGLPMPRSFEQWISWKLGKNIAEEYMLPYNRKIWSISLNRLGTYWLYKLPNVSFRETLQSCLDKKPNGTIPAHETFLYPKEHGYGEIWKRMGEALEDQLLTSMPVVSIDVRNMMINDMFKAGKIINTIPWTQWLHISNVPKSVKGDIKKLHFASIDVDYYSEQLSTNAQWVYEPDERLSYHRILCRKNFCNGEGYWTETNSKRATTPKGLRFSNEYAYPLNTRDKPSRISNILIWARRNHIMGLGRWGTWEHMNSDVAVSLGIKAAKQAMGIQC
jgi:protoporphyrinogen oxidase